MDKIIKKTYYVHSSSCIDKNVSIGKGTNIWHFCHIMKNAEIGRDCTIGQNVFIAAGVKIGKNVKIQNNVSVYKGVTLEDDCFCGPSAVFTNVLKPRSAYSVNGKYAKTFVKKGATIGANATIVCGVTLGRYSFVAAGSVVTKDVPDYGLVMGNPARLKGFIGKRAERL